MTERRVRRLNTHSKRTQIQQRINTNDDAEFERALEEWLDDKKE